MRETALNCFFIILCTAFGLSGCGLFENEQDFDITRIKLQNHSNHEGIFIKYVESDTFSVTQKDGSFDLPNLDDGTYTIEIKFPYFEIRKKTIDVVNNEILENFEITLTQLIQFEIVTSNITLSKGSGEQEFIETDSLPDLEYKIHNLTSSPIRFVSNFGDKFELIALKPVDFSWPVYPNPDNLPNPCVNLHGFLGPNDTILDKSLEIDGHGTLSAKIKLPHLTNTCFPLGDYEIIAGINNDFYHPEHLLNGYFYLINKPPDELGAPNFLNQFLFDKSNLFISKTLTIKK